MSLFGTCLTLGPMPNSNENATSGTFPPRWSHGDEVVILDLLVDGIVQSRDPVSGEYEVLLPRTMVVSIEGTTWTRVKRREDQLADPPDPLADWEKFWEERRRFRQFP